MVLGHVHAVLLMILQQACVLAIAWFIVLGTRQAAGGALWWQRRRVAGAAAAAEATVGLPTFMGMGLLASSIGNITIWGLQGCLRCIPIKWRTVWLTCG